MKSVKATSSPPRVLVHGVELRMTADRYEGRSKQAVGARLELTRHALGLDQGDFAHRAGLKANTYNQYETGTNMPQLSAAHALCDTYHLTLDWIYRGDQSGLRYETGQAIHNMRKVRSSQL